MSLEGAIAVHRFGLGGRPGEIAAASADPRGWLAAQIQGPADQPEAVDSPLLPSSALSANFRVYVGQRRQLRQGGSKDAVTALVPGDIFASEMAARFRQGFVSTRPFAERLVWFWSNHFTISIKAGRVFSYAGAFEREAIRPHIAGRFEDMLLAVTQHPAMLAYLNNIASVGPNSRAGQVRGVGLNENLGRELMELYSLGVDGGYTQADVVAMAKLLTGWGIDPDSGFRFFPQRHEPGPITLRGKSYGGGLEGGIAAVRDLARDPHTARHIAVKLATYFIADAPSPQSVARLEQTFIKTGGDLKALALAVLDDPAAWPPAPVKMRSPVEYVTAAFRMLDLPRGPNPLQQVRAAMSAARLMGEFPASAPSPKGWPLTSDAWAGPDAILSRIEWAKQAGGRMPPGFDAVKIGEAALGPFLRPATRAAMAGAQTPGDALAFLLSSPEFQRR